MWRTVSCMLSEISYHIFGITVHISKKNIC